MDNNVRQEQDQEKINMERAKLMQDQVSTMKRMQQNEELAELRADTSLTKTQWVLIKRTR